MSKRIFGYLNWVKNRRHAMGTQILSRLLADLEKHSPDHIAITGDLVNIATDAEFAAAAAWLATVGPPERVSLVPGNHDAYVPGAAARATTAWARWIVPPPAEGLASADGAPRFPVVRRVGPIALFGVSTAVATPPLFASGRVGSAQLATLSALLDRHDDAFKVVMIHHPPDRTLSHGRRGLGDVDAVRSVLSDGCVDLVLHGHTHKPSLTYLETPRGRAAIVGTPSASSDGSKHPPGGYALIDLAADGTVRLTRRAVAGPDAAVRTVETLDLDLTAPLAAA